MVDWICNAAALLSACTTTSANDPPWIKFNFSSAWTARGEVRGTISRTGAVTIEARRWVDGKRIAFERQLRPNELGRLQQAIAEHRTRFGAEALGSSTAGLWGVAMLVPCLNGLTLLILSSKANAACRANGVAVGLFGPRI